MVWTNLDWGCDPVMLSFSRLLRVIRWFARNRSVNAQRIRYAMAGCIVALAAAVAYAMIRLFVMSQRVDASIFVINVVVFAGIAGFMIYLAKKERDIEEKEFFRD